MAPEQARGDVTTAASDRYALACVAYELLCGRRPFVRANPTAEAHAHATEEPPPPRSFDPSLPAALDAVFARALAKEPAARYPSCAAFVDELGSAFEPATTATSPVTAATVVAPSAPSVPSPPPAPAGGPVTRHVTRGRRTATLVLVGGLLAAGALFAWGLASLGASDSGTATVVVTRTAQGRTVEETVTQSNTVTQTVESSPPTRETDGSALNDQGFQLLQQGNPQGALPLLESAVAALAGSGSTTEAYASYNLAWARFATGGCDGVAELLDRSEEIQGRRKEIDRLRKQVEKTCGD
jgi:serine/threonine protein kinase